jgi:hypothetical protein
VGRSSNSVQSKATSSEGKQKSKKKTQTRIANEIDKATHMDPKKLKRVISETQSRGIHHFAA